MGAVKSFEGFGGLVTEKEGKEVEASQQSPVIALTPVTALALVCCQACWVNKHFLQKAPPQWIEHVHS